MQRLMLDRWSFALSSIMVLAALCNLLQHRFHLLRCCTGQLQEMKSNGRLQKSAAMFYLLRKSGRRENKTFFVAQAMELSLVSQN